jgi:hypothetical protein
MGVKSGVVRDPDGFRAEKGMQAITQPLLMRWTSLVPSEPGLEILWCSAASVPCDVQSHSKGHLIPATDRDARLSPLMGRGRLDLHAEKTRETGNPVGNHGTEQYGRRPGVI